MPVKVLSTGMFVTFILDDLTNQQWG